MEDSNERLACGEKKLWGPGRWELGVIAPPQYYVSSLLDASSGGQTHDLLLRPRESKEITVLLGGRPASLRGKVLTSDGVPAPGAPVFLNAVTSDLQRRVGGTRLVRADPDGVYSFVGLPPGEYEVLSAFHLVAEEAWPAGAGTPIRLAEGEEAVLEVRVAAARD
jgi:hypothetical protein